MNKLTNLLIIEGNTPNLPPASAAFADVFARFDPFIQVTIAQPYVAPVELDDLTDIDGVIFTGAGVAWSTDAPEGQVQRDAMECVFAHKAPAWGSCNGMQLAATVLGGAVGGSPNGLEVGVARDTRRVGDHPMFAGRAEIWTTPCIHRDEVQRLPEGAILTATNDHSPIQGFAYAKDGVEFWGTQYHPELRTTHIADYLRDRNGIFTDKAAMIADLDAAETQEQAATRLGTTCAELAFENRTVELANWLSHVKNKAAIRSLQQIYPNAVDFIFGDSRGLSDRLNDLVLSEHKTATCGALRDYHAEGEALPRTGDFAIATDWDGRPVAVIKTKTANIMRFCDVSWDFAKLEGEDDVFEGWQNGHRAYFERNGGFDPHMELVCETFELVADLR